MNLDHVKNNGTTSMSINSTKFAVTTSSAVNIRENGHITVEQIHENMPTKQLCDPYPQALMIKKDVGYIQRVVIRSYEVGPDKTATIESILNLLQETALNHVWMSGLLGDGFGAAHGMTRNVTVWVLLRMHLQDHPIWGKVSEIDTWVVTSGKNKIRRDWQIPPQTTGLVYAHATRSVMGSDFLLNHNTKGYHHYAITLMIERFYSTWVKPHEVKAEISPWFSEERALEDAPEKIEKSDDNVNNVNSILKVRRNDLDMNHHVNNVKYIGWMLETIPDEDMEENQLADTILDYNKECDTSDVLQSFGIFDGVQQTSNDSLIIEFLLASDILQKILQTEELNSKEMVRERTCQSAGIDGFTIIIIISTIIIIIIITIKRGYIVIIIIIVVVLDRADYASLLHSLLKKLQ
ncbi:Acyl-[acyl-carrier-protein] hydrolase [Heracleum sosnowskyi]|uniref:Acyl-[acyl-carrier-protein] hydrolase n=1 Tax=Heracleum sosnowskyi TaxID=360622 RepID=A0AAD8MVW1_9APIA|nr:Acyl-[acyl-carrier-protein] hydrolase [Heracleum sosnowskyi]